ncbi:GNAT family N-acetyltransferase [Clostridium sp. 19966]|uniref:GNAT family N-acetyltransferase n=1 Tax=Clostridium sp. 19966 TaxID=2768166 RepID=UPI0028DE3CE0|nr:GNAT family N-acetyltransferase [Clostridium sp. 19966]MDT8718184.1 GNAT family N-acetyltransferase [Clostridium sp. 19966]
MMDMFSERIRLINIRGASNCLIDFDNNPFSISEFSNSYSQLDAAFYVNTIDLIHTSKLTIENKKLIISKLKSLPHIKHVYDDEEQFHFRPAYKEDIKNLIPIFATNSIKNGGTLICEDAAPNESNIDTVYVLEFLGELVAYVSLENKNIIHYDMRESIMLFDKKFNEEDYIYIKQCAVLRGYQGRGFGSTLYKELFNYFTNCSFYSHVSTKNIQSLRLHYRNGFYKMGIYQSANFHGAVNDYISDLVYRPIQISNKKTL